MTTSDAAAPRGPAAHSASDTDPASLPDDPAHLGTAPAPDKPVNLTRLYLGFTGMVIGQFMAILDIQIVAASLNDIQAGVGASADEISWVQTIYLLAEVLIIPLTAYLSRLYSTQKFFMACAVAFMITSVLVGLSNDIVVMIVFRALQGLAAGAMIPMVFSVAFTAFPPDKRGSTNVVMGMIISLAPTLGPTLGGHLTELASWRWLFFVNVPPGLLAFFLVWKFGDFDKAEPGLGKNIDWWGLALMAVALLGIQYVLEEGSKEGWFDDALILWLTVASVLAGAAFVWRELVVKQPIVNLRPFQDRNFTIGVIMNFIAGFVLFGAVFLLPLYLGQIRRYSSAEIGTVMIVSGAVMFISGPVLGRFLREMDPRIPLVTGFALIAWSMWLGHGVTGDWGFWEFATMQAVRSLGLMVCFIAMQPMTVSTLHPSLIKDASGLMNLMRNTGGAIGLAILSTNLGDQRAVHLNQLAAGVPVGSRAEGMMNGLVDMMTARGVVDPEGAARKAIGSFLQRDAAILAFGDSFALMAAIALAAALLGFIAAPPKNKGGPGGGGH